MPRKLLRRLLPAPHWIREHRLLAWLGPSLHHPRVWHVSREGIALGVAIGVFFGLLIPIAQIPIAAAAAITLRANLPISVVGTFITNPFTFAPLYYCAYRIGLMATGADQPAVVTEASFDTDARELAGWLNVWSGQILAFGKPLFVGLLVMACAFSVFGYFSVHGLWRALTLRAWRRRVHARKAANSGPAGQ